MNLLDLESEKFKTVDVKGETFKIRFMSPMDKVMIAKRRMNLQGGNPVEAMMMSDLALFENISMIDVCVEEFPKGVDKSKSAINWDDEEMIMLLAEEIRIHTSEVQGKLKKNKPIG